MSESREVRGASFNHIRMRGVELLDIEISGELLNVVVSGVDIAPLVEAELDRAKTYPNESDGFVKGG